MRWEWRDTIRFRRWDEFEQLAKADPSQQLCDTVAELEEGLEDKADQKTLRRILFILKGKGFSPTSHAEEPTLVSVIESLATLGTYGVMSSPSEHGSRMMFFGQLIGNQLHALVANSMESFGGIKVRTFDLNPKMWEATIREDLLTKFPAHLKAEVEPGYVLSRIRRAWERRDPNNDAIFKTKLTGFWKRMLNRVPADAPHPALLIRQLDSATAAQRRAFVSKFEPVREWRVFVPPKNPAWEDIHAARWEEGEEGVDAERYLDILLAHRESLANDTALWDMVHRFLDVALLIGDKESEEARLAVHCASQLAEHGGKSDVFETLLEETARHLEEDIEADEDDPAGVRRFMAEEFV